MGTEANQDRETALRPLRTIGGVLASLRSGSLAADEVPAAIVRVADAVEMSLRRLLRDLTAASLEVRLRALASDELRADEVLAELRQHDRISMPLAASVHELLEARRRLQEGGGVQPADAPLATRVADRLEHEIVEPAPAPPVAPPADATLSDETLVHPVPVAEARGWRPRREHAIGLGAVLLVFLVAFGVWRMMPGGRSDELNRGVELFNAGSYQDAASHFWRAAQADPEDPVPHIYLARVHRRLRRFDMAAGELRKALDLAPGDADAVAEVGFLHLDLGRYDQAVERFRAVLKAEPEKKEAWIGLVRALRLSGRREAADRVLASAPADVRALLTQPAAPPRPDTLPLP